jgi:hypothetical protein
MILLKLINYIIENPVRLIPAGDGKKADFLNWALQAMAV